MGSVHQHLRLDDRNEILFLTERGVPCQRVRIRANADGARQSVRDMDDRPPLGETGTHAMVLREAIPEPVEPLGDGFTRRAGERLRAGVDLDTGKDPLRRKNLGEGRAGGALLTDRLILQNDAADELSLIRRGEEHFSAGAPAPLGGLDAQRIEPLRQGGNALVGCENPFPLGDQRRRNALEILAHHGKYLLRVPFRISPGVVGPVGDLWRSRSKRPAAAGSLGSLTGAVAPSSARRARRRSHGRKSWYTR